MTMNYIETIFIDYDGVISKNSMNLITNFMCDFINRFRPIDIDTIISYVKIVNCFSVNESIGLLFTSLGLEKEIDDFRVELDGLKEYKGMCLKIEEDLCDFISFCNESNIKYRIFSLASGEKIYNTLNSYFNYNQRHGYFDYDNILTCKNASKADPNLYKKIHDETGIDISHCLVIDDNPLTLIAAKQSGAYTSMMTNDIFNNYDYSIYKNYIDFVVSSFTKLKQIIAEKVEASYVNQKNIIS